MDPFEALQCRSIRRTISKTTYVELGLNSRRNRISFCRSGMEMALMNSHDMPLRSHRSWSGVAAFGPKFWGTGAAFMAIYFALNLLTQWHEFDRLGITLWSPDDGLSLARLLQNVGFGGFVFLAAVLVDVSIAGVHRSIGATMAAELCL